VARRRDTVRVRAPRGRRGEGADWRLRQCLVVCERVRAPRSAKCRGNDQHPTTQPTNKGQKASLTHPATSPRTHLTPRRLSHAPIPGDSDDGGRARSRQLVHVRSNWFEDQVKRASKICRCIDAGKSWTDRPGRRHRRLPAPVWHERRRGP